jgi:hypothetical protein
VEASLRRSLPQLAAKDGTLIGWSIDKVHGVSIIRGTAIKPNPDQRHPPFATPIAMRLLWWSHDCFGCHDGADCFQGSTHVFKQGEPAIDPFPYLTATLEKAGWLT